ncbi:hypothetical protein [Sediminicoccus sp. BL-A-41-H5]|jgi:hypothetical protein|uniref:hypothetical protein n=1 Tax=Sediminicoccus sp. BL-A-41-H5 TaxID=3421106 RepID=UPI003D66E1A2
MRNLLILITTAPLLMAQGLPRPYCGYGEGLAALREVAREAALPVPGILEGRARGEAVLRSLSGAATTFTACGCPRLVELTREAERVAQSAPSEASIARLSQVFGQVAFRTQLAQEQSERAGCR